MKKSLIIFGTCVFLMGCNKHKWFDGPNFYTDDFESYSLPDDLLLSNDELWSYTQITKSNNYIAVDSSRAHTGTKSMKFYASQSDDVVSKCSLAKQNMAFWEGETLRMSGWFYIEDTQSLDWLFLMDMEEQTAIGAGPGMRLAMVENKLRIEYKFNEDDIVQPNGQEIGFPRNQWVEIVWEVKLSRKKKGSVRLWQDGQLLIESNSNRTLPKDILYFQQGTKGMYSSCEVGITANSKDNALTMWVDDVKFEKVD
jgi:hypothetical protein